MSAGAFQLAWLRVSVSITAAACVSFRSIAVGSPGAKFPECNRQNTYYPIFEFVIGDNVLATDTLTWQFDRVVPWDLELIRFSVGFAGTTICKAFPFCRMGDGWCKVPGPWQMA